jgi:hypothetical protein
VVRGDDDWSLTRDIAEAFNFGAEGAHQERGQKGPQDSIGQVIEHVPNLAAIAPYDSIWG